MAFSHVGVKVSNLASSTSFYAAALQPLGFRCVGKRGSAVGFGVESADFMIEQAPRGVRISPTHIAFHADSRSMIRECYSAALRAHGLPNGAPDYRNDECSCYSAAIEDLDGHTVEFILREPHGLNGTDDRAPSQHSRVLTWQEEVINDGNEAPEYGRSLDSSDRLSTSQTPRARSRIDTVLELGSSVSKAVKPSVPVVVETPTSRSFSDLNKLVAGMGLGAAAGAAIMYTMLSTEQRNSRDEAIFEATIKPASARRPPPPPTNETVPHTPPTFSKSTDRHRNFSTTESNFSARRPQVLAIDSLPYDKTEEISGIYETRRAPVYQTAKEYVYVPASEAASSNSFGMRRAATLPAETENTHYSIEAPPSARRSSHHDVPRSFALKPSSRYESPRSVTSSRHSSAHQHRSSHEERSSRHDSAISLHSSRSYYHRANELEERAKSTASTTKPPPRELVRRRSSKATSGFNDSSRRPAAIAPSRPRAGSATLRPASHYESAIEIPLPGSAASMPHKASSRISAANHPLPESVLGEGNAADTWEDIVHESDGMDDIGTVVPDDSISMVGSKHRRRRHHSHSASKHGSSSRRSEASDRTTTPVRAGSSRHSAMTLPVRVMYEGFDKSRGSKRSIYSYA